MTQCDLEWPRTAKEIVRMTQYDFRWVNSTSVSPFWGPSHLDILLYNDLVTSHRQTTTLWWSKKIFDPIVNHYTTSKDVKCRFMSTQSARCVMCFARLKNHFIGLFKTHENLKFSDKNSVIPSYNLKKT